MKCINFFIDLLTEKEGKKLLNYSLRLAIRYLKNVCDGSLFAVKAQKECRKFVETLGLQVLHMNPALPNEETIKYLGELMLLSAFMQKNVYLHFNNT